MTSPSDKDPFKKVEIRFKGLKRASFIIELDVTVNEYEKLTDFRKRELMADKVAEIQWWFYDKEQ